MNELFDSALHKELFCCFIAESCSCTYRQFECFNTQEEMDTLINTIINEYELMYEDQIIYEELKPGLESIKMTNWLNKL